MSLITSYSPMPVTFTHGEGVWLYDEQGKKYLDGLSGIAVCGLGHAHPDVTRTIQEQAARLIHTSNVFHIKEQELLAAKLTSMARMEQVFLLILEQKLMKQPSNLPVCLVIKRELKRLLLL